MRSSHEGTRGSVALYLYYFVHYVEPVTRLVYENARENCGNHSLEIRMPQACVLDGSLPLNGV